MSKLVPITKVGSIGLVRDRPGYELPPEGWSSVKNMRFFDDAAIRMYGHVNIFGNPSVVPYHIFPALVSAGNFYVYAGLGTLYVTDGTTHDQIGSGLSGGRDNRWNGGMFGNIGIFNNGVSDPQMWSPPAIATNVAGLTNWPVNTKAKIIRPFGRFLIAYDITEVATNYPNRVKWSSSAPTGAVPATWDETDPTKDSREWDLAETAGAIVDAKALGPVNFVYKEDETHAMTWTGGQFVFDFKRRFPFGLLAQDCVVEYRRKHVLATFDDIIAHDGLQDESLLKKKMRQWFAGRLDQPQRSFMARAGNEIILGFCELGQTEPNVGLFLNLEDLTCSIRDLPGLSFITTAQADVQTGVTTFDSVTTVFDDLQGVFGLREYTVGKERFIACQPGNQRIILLDESFDDAGVTSPSAFLERTGLTITGVDRFGQPRSDPQTVKQVHRLWPNVQFLNGNTLKVSCGASYGPNEPITWVGPYDYVPSLCPYVDFEDVVGTHIAVRFQTDNTTLWRMDGYDVELDVIGRVGT